MSRYSQGSFIIFIFFYTVEIHSTEPFFTSHTHEYVSQVNKDLEKALALITKKILQGIKEEDLRCLRNAFVNHLESVYQENALLPETCRVIICEFHYYQRNKEKLRFIDHTTFNKIRPFIINETMIKDDYKKFLTYSASNPILINELLYKYKLLQVSNGSHTPAKQCADTLINSINYVMGTHIKNFNSSLIESILNDAYDYGFIVEDKGYDGQHPLFKGVRPLKNKNLIQYIHGALQPNLYNDVPVYTNISPALKKKMTALVTSLKVTLKSVKVPKVLFFYIMDFMKKYNEACHMKALILQDSALIQKSSIKELNEATTYLKSDTFWRWFDAQAVE